MDFIKFENKVKSMSIKEIVLAMVEGLRNPKTDKVDISSWGEVSEGLCIGCAATNCILLLSESEAREEISIEGRSWRNGPNFLIAFEDAINYLRQRALNSYNRIASKNGFATLSEESKVLIRRYADVHGYLSIYDDFTEEILNNWEIIAHKYL